MKRISNAISCSRHLAKDTVAYLLIFSQTNVTFLITADTNAQQAHNAVTVEKVLSVRVSIGDKANPNPNPNPKVRVRVRARVKLGLRLELVLELTLTLGLGLVLG